ncbi:MAG TPA: PKD domain-containing protein [Candidatus Thermoplasmatota archaeon]|nr:PKD domain-containing protein [Candidatus Thermoplasmatota archaeon]
MRPLIVLVLATATLAAPLALGLAPNSPPHADFAFSPSDPQAGVRISFHSTSVDDGAILLEEWDFGDGAQAIGAHVTHAFARAGIHNVTLRVTDEQLAVGIVTRSIFVLPADPVATIKVSSSEAHRGQAIAFTADVRDADGDAIVNWTWSFGDGTWSLQQAPTHAYDALGTYNVSLWVLDSGGSWGHAHTFVRVVNAPPIVAQADADRRFGAVGDTFRFRAEAFDPDGDLVGYAWSFPDGTVLEGQEVAHAFSRGGLHRVVLTVTDADGGVATRDVRVLVRPAT